MIATLRARALVTLVLALESPAFAEPVQDDITGSNNTVGAAFALRHLEYREFNDGLIPKAPSTLDSETGWLAGARIEARAQRTIFDIPNVLLAANVEQVAGVLDYVGLSMHASRGQVEYRPATGRSGARMTELGALVGVGIPLGDVASITPLVRYSFRNWHRTLQTHSPSEYLEVYEHHELAGGALFQVAPLAHVVFGVDASLGATLAPALENGLFHPFSVLTDLGWGPTFRGGVSADYAITSGLPGVHAVVRLRHRGVSLRSIRSRRPARSRRNCPYRTKQHQLRERASHLRTGWVLTGGSRAS